MRKLMPSQFLTVQSLLDNPLISSVDVELTNNGLSRITIKSAVNAPWDGSEGVDMVISLALDANFPGLEYLCTPAKYTNPADGLEHELYFINYEGETLINLIMRSDSEQKEKPSAPTDSKKKTTQVQFTRNDEVLELAGPCESFV